MKRNERGFTLVELLAVIVILGLLMAIAIPSVTKYITQSRVKTLVSTMDSYITAVVTQVNDGEYKFSDSTKVFAIPIECISLEKGGTNPFGNWYQANENYWAYVLVHYDSANYNYEYGFTFKDDAGYGLYPTLNSMIENSMVKTGYVDLNQPKDGLAKDFVPLDKWKGFSNVTESTELVVLESESEGIPGDGVDTCTLFQKGDNYGEVEKKKEDKNKLTSLIKKHNEVVTQSPSLDRTSINDTSGLYISTSTNNELSTYYFRGNVTNNYVLFAELIWRIVRINEDGTVRLILQEGINNNAKYIYNSNYSNIKYMYYSSNSDISSTLSEWYDENVYKKGFDEYVTIGVYCEANKVNASTSAVGGGSYCGNYEPTFYCFADSQGKSVVNNKVGLISVDEVFYAGGHCYSSNENFYLNNGYNMFVLSPSGFSYSNNSAQVWYVHKTGTVQATGVKYKQSIRPVINLNANVVATGTGTSSDPYVVQTN